MNMVMRYPHRASHRRYCRGCHRAISPLWSAVSVVAHPRRRAHWPARTDLRRRHALVGRRDDDVSCPPHWNPSNSGYPPAPPEVSYHQITTAAELSDALRIISRVFDVPPYPMSRWTNENPAFTLIGALGNQPVATVATLPAGGTIGVYHVATLPEARRRGIAGNLLLLALRDAQAAGYGAATLTATPAGQQLYTQLGFGVCGLLEQWMTGPRLTDDLIRHGDPLAR